MKGFFSVMLKCKEEIYERRDRASAEAYKKVQTFVESGCYSSCKKAKDIAQMSLRGCSVKDIALKYNLSSDTIKHEKRLMSMKLWDIFPSDFFDKLVDYRSNRDFVDDCLYSLSVYELKSADFILLDVVNAIKSKNTNVTDIDMSDFSNEIDFLHRYSKVFFDRDLESVDIGKLSYLLGIIDGSSGNALVRAEVLKELKGVI